MLFLYVFDGFKSFVFRHTIGINREEYMSTQPVGQRMLGEVYRSGELYFVEDYRLYPHRIDKELLSNFTTGLMMPLRIGGKVMGILTANWQNEVHLVREEDIEIFRQYGNLASIALDRAHAGQKIAHQNLLLQKLAETTTSLVNELNLDKALQNILTQATSFMGIADGFIQLFEPDGNHAQIKCGSGRYEALVGNVMRFEGKGIFGEVLRTGRPVVINDYANWPKRLEGAFFEELTAEMQAPLSIEGKTLGSIGLTVIITALDVAGLPVGQVALDVSLQVITSPSSGA